ncbi:unnamed protein product [Phytomonas sp. Hart1]|nr:unnamed protein product [Phytomonas sp. Hart1]|eukprot:CCW66113.1 unnamed protein product [Phytomonas sp. isolate Hart1]
MYTNLNEAYLLGLTAELTNPIQYFGSGTKSFTTQTSVLVPIDMTNHAKLFSMCSKEPQVMASAWCRFLKNFPFPTSFYDIRQSITLVPFSSSTNSGLSIRYDLNCLINAIEAYRTSSHPGLPSIDAIVVNGDDVIRKTLVKSSAPSYDNWKYSNLTTLVYAGGSLQWNDVVDKARFNEKRWQRGYDFPVYALETHNQMHLMSTRDDCLSSSSLTCQPLGGWSVWATTGNSSWSWSDTRHSFEPKTAEGAIALMVPLTTATFGNLPAPGADSPASGITAALAITEAIKRKAPNIEVATFFLLVSTVEPLAVHVLFRTHLRLSHVRRLALRHA